MDYDNFQYIVVICWLLGSTTLYHHRKKTSFKIEIPARPRIVLCSRPNARKHLKSMQHLTKGFSRTTLVWMCSKCLSTICLGTQNDTNDRHDRDKIGDQEKNHWIIAPNSMDHACQLCWCLGQMSLITRYPSSQINTLDNILPENQLAHVPAYSDI